MKMIWLFPTSFSLSDEQRGRKVTAQIQVPAHAKRRAGSRTPSPSSFALPSFGGQARERPARRSFSEGGGGLRGKLQSGFV
jgi:hypothetical protein